jgi:hypothetical protein
VFCAANTCGALNLITNSTMVSLAPVNYATSYEGSDTVVQATISCIIGNRFDDGEQTRIFYCPDNGYNNYDTAVSSWQDVLYGMCLG